MLNQFKLSVDNVLSANNDWKNLIKEYTSGNFPLAVSGADGLWSAVLISKLSDFTGGSILIVTPDEASAKNLTNDISLFTDNVDFFPWWGSMLYRGVSPQSSVFGKRTEILSTLASGKKKIIVSSLRASLGLLPPPEYTKKNILNLKTSDSIDLPEIENKLQLYGYTRVPRVTVPGEFALRGEVLDIAPPGMSEAVRIVFEWDEIDEIKLFDPVNQVSLDQTDSIIIYPVKEVIWNENTVNKLKEKLEKSINYESVIEEIENTGNLKCEELYYPLAFTEKTTIQDYLSSKSVTFFINDEHLEIAEKNMFREFNELYENAAADNSTAIPEPEQLVSDLQKLKNAERRVEFKALHKDNAEIKSFRLPNEPGRSFFGNITFFKEELLSLKESGFEIFIFAESESQAQRIEYLLKDIQDIHVGSSRISAGFMLPDSGIFVIQENEIFGRRKHVPSSVKKSKTAVIESFVDLEPGDYVVHLNYGIGKFEGIKRIKAAGAERDYITLLYSGGERIFIPIEQVNLIQRYIGQEGGKPKLDKIGSSAWEKKKNKVKKSVSELAEKLIKLYARRQSLSGFAFPQDDDFQINFEASFPWEETEDQLTAIADVKNDMERPKPMDRLICGDVGYGKTEIAMRAAFKAVMGGRQVAYLCPTTILTEQHHESFTERFKRFPVTVAMLSRFVSAQEQKKIINGLKNGEVDIVIGTHRLLSKDVEFKNLGLIIIDEEQRFGVKDKEKLKEIKTTVDCLTLSATPIPRTLHMSLVKIRDMSILKTPPSNRQPIETFIQEFDPELIAEVIRREVERGGQVFYLHNRVESLEYTKKFISSLVPEVFVESAHGQMNPRELEEVMHRFINGAFQVLVSTTIIENGIDIPNVNTIIIDRADMYGISQLYQLRGRVGRSGRLAYAYLLYPENREISELAMKRLQIISDFTELGSGFKIAMKDLEVRGAGNLLGAEQSGDVSAVGFDLYLKLLDDAIREKSGEEEENIPETYLELDYSGYIPDSYIQDPSEKMEVYKKIAAVSSEEELEKLYSELYDRFGPLPDEVHSLISLSELRIICRKLNIFSLKERKGKASIIFGKVSLISVDKIMNLINSSAGKVRLDPQNPGGIIIETDKIDLKDKTVFIRERLETLLT